jgi:DnaJ-class molecular chaperone
MLVLWIIAVVGGFGYLISLHVHPYTRCHWCHGGGRHRGMLYGYATRACGHCGGNGRQLRFGARLFLGGTERK